MKEHKIAVIGLGYVGLPLAVEFSKYFNTVGFDINKSRINELRNFSDNTNEVDNNDLKDSIVFKDQISKPNKKGLFLSNKIEDILACNIFIITVPTPIDNNLNPDLRPLITATKTIGKILKKGDIVIYESTVYPGATEEDCVPILEIYSKLRFNIDFFVGYSPERINPGDKKKTITKIVKVVSGSNLKTTKTIDSLYKKIIKAGTYIAPTIKIAEAAKVIENSQRDINIAFVNELAKIFNLMDIDTNSVLEAASTKWNFLPFKPGLVGGHCIGVDPYYLANKSKSLGYEPKIILSGRSMNDSMSKFISDCIDGIMKNNNINVKNSKALILGVTFKENCPDIRNSKVFDLINCLSELGLNINIFDPHADKVEVQKTFNLKIQNEIIIEVYDLIILAVSHAEFLKLKYNDLKHEKTIIYDIKGFLGEVATHRL